MRNEDKLIKVAHYNTKLNSVLGFDYSAFTIYRSKGLLTHLIKRKHFVAAKYIDRLDDIISHPDYAGCYNGNIELVKCYNDNIFVSIKLDEKESKYYIATVFDVKKGKIDSYVKSGRLVPICSNIFGYIRYLDFIGNQWYHHCIHLTSRKGTLRSHGNLI